MLILGRRDLCPGKLSIARSCTVKPLQGQSWDPPNQNVERRLGVLMNPYVPSDASGTVLQLFVGEPFNDTIASLISQDSGLYGVS